MKSAIIDVGGGMRDIYGAGIFDRCLDDHVHFDVGVGVSAGSANIASFLTGQRRRNYAFFTDYMLRKECMSIGNFFSKGCYLDISYVYSELSNHDGVNPLDFPALMKSPADYYAVATNAETGKAKYFTRDDMSQDHYEIMTASCSVPTICKPCKIGDSYYYDGALSDCIPFDKAMELECDRIVLILSRPISKPRNSRQDSFLASLIRRRFPNAAEALSNRYKVYNAQVERAKELEEFGRIFIISPDDACGVHTLSKKVPNMDTLYWRGYRAAGDIKHYLAGASPAELKEKDKETEEPEQPFMPVMPGRKSKK